MSAGTIDTRRYLIPASRAFLLPCVNHSKVISTNPMSSAIIQNVINSIKYLDINVNVIESEKASTINCK